jgi:4-diphosphocytidyl-2-C-methyl-D-erythritol kinase
MLTLKAPAKINWFLKVLGLRNDGYHDIQSLMQKISLYDTLSFAGSANLVVECESQIPVEENLVYRAAELLKNAYDVKYGAHIRLEKHIPTGAGLGGGSSDAATALMGLNQLWSLNCSREDLCAIARQLGSDIPFFLYGPVSFAYGRGEKISSRMAQKILHVLLVKPHIFVSTAWAYKNFRVSGEGHDGVMKGFYSKLTKKAGKVNNIEHFIRVLEDEGDTILPDAVLNDLESVTVKEFPVIAEIKDKLRKAGAVLAAMSGSGPTVFGLFESRRETEDASRIFEEHWTAAVETIID